MEPPGQAPDASRGPDPSGTRAPSLLAALPTLPLVAAGLLLVGGVLAAVGLGVPWTHIDGSVQFGGAFGFGGGNFQFSGDYDAFNLHFAGESTSYSDDALDDSDGIGKLRAGGPLLALGMGVAFLALVLAGLEMLVPRRHLDWAALGAAGLGLTIHLVGLLLLAGGIHDSIEGSFGDSVTASQQAGFWLSAAAALLLLGAVGVLVAGAVLRLRGERGDAGGGDTGRGGTSDPFAGA